MTACVLLSVMTMAGQTKTRNTKDISPIHLTTREFKEKVYDYEANPDTFKYEGDIPAIVDFFATWCGPCKALSPVLDELAKEYEGKIVIYKVDVDKSQELARVFGIRSIPTLLFIPKEGKPTLSTGAPSKAQMKDVIEKMVK